MATIIRGDENDRIRGTQDDDIINAGGGDDDIRAGDGDDLINGGDGDDIIRTEQGADTAIGGRGNDIIEYLGGGGDDILIGVDPDNGAGRGEIDIFRENGNSVRFDLRRGERETIVLGNEATAFYVGEGNNDFARIQNFRLEFDRIQLHGSPEQYEIRRLRGVGFNGAGIFFEGELIAGLEDIRFSDLSLESSTFAFAEDVERIGSPEADVLLGGPGNDRLLGQAGNDRIEGGPGDDELLGDAGRDNILGGLGNDQLSGGTGDDVLNGTDTVVGVRGNEGRGEVDILTGGADEDTFFLAITQGGGQNSLLYNDGDPTNAGLGAFAVITDFEAGVDQFVLAGSRLNYVIGASPIEAFQGDALFLDTNANTQLDDTDELIAIFAGFNNLEAIFNAEDAIDDEVVFIALPDGVIQPDEDLDIEGSDRDDQLSGAGGNDQIDGGAGDDQVSGDAGRDILVGGLGNDQLSGDTGNDVLNGADTVDGFRGNEGRGEVDILTGGADEDFFALAVTQGGGQNSLLYNDGDPTNAGLGDFAVITDFEAGVDQFILAGSRLNYVIGASPIEAFQGDALFLDTNANTQLDDTDELIAIFEGFNNLEAIFNEENTIDNIVFGGDLPDGVIQPDENSTVIEEVEVNNTLRDAQDIGEVGQIPVTIVGNVKSDQRPGPDEDPVDVFKFEVTEPSQFNADLISTDETVTGLRLIKDFNNDGRNNFDDLLASSPTRGEDRIQFDRLDPGTYFVQVGVGTGAGVDYELQFNTPAIETAQLNLNLLDIFPLSAGSIANPAPVRFEAEICDQVFEQRFEDDFSPTLLTADVDINQRNIPIKIRAFSLNPDGTETQFDIGSGSEEGDLEFDATYDTLDRRLFKTGTAIRANEGQSILQIVRGDGDGGRIRLNVTYDTFTENQLVPDTADIQSSASGTDQDDTLIGTDINGLLSGKAGNDLIDTAGGDDIAFGGPGDDLIAGGLGNDLIRGGLGNDTLRGDLNNRSPQSNIDGGDDTIFGGDGNDRIGGKSGDDTLSGEQGDDTIFGDAGNDSLSGGSGDDELMGGAGDDQLAGDQGDDVLTGVDPDSKTPGFGEFDQMTGGLGSDRFVLGDRKRTYYLGQGEVDHAAIFDFSLAEGDVIQLHGEAADYSLGAFTAGDIAGVDISTSKTGDLVGSIVGVSLAELSLTDTAAFDFV